VQTEFGDINAKFDDFTTRFKALGLLANKNWERREACVGDDARPIFKPVYANPRGQYHHGYSSDEKDLFSLMRGTYMNRKEKKNMFGDLPRDQPYVRSIPKIPFRQPYIYVKGVGEDELDGDHETSGNEQQVDFIRT